MKCDRKSAVANMAKEILESEKCGSIYSLSDVVANLAEEVW